MLIPLDRIIVLASIIPCFKDLGMRNLQYEIRICQKSYSKVTKAAYVWFEFLWIRRYFTHLSYIICTAVLISGRMYCYFFITSLLFQLYLLFTAWTLKFVHIRFDSVNPFFIIIKKWWTISNFKFVIELMLSNIL